MILLSTGLTLVTHQASGQSATLSGLVTDSLENLPLPGAHVRLATPHDSTLRETILGEKGNFLFRQLPAGDVVLTVEFLGFATFNKQIRLIENQDYAAGTIRMAPRPTELGAIEVVGKPVPVQIKGDTTEFNAAAFTTTPYADAEELIKKLPGVEVGLDGSVKAQGEDISRVLVDGKEFFGNEDRKSVVEGKEGGK